jgi:hypothetical protein
MHRFTTHGDNKSQDSSLSKLEKLKNAILGYDFIHPYKISILHEVTFALPTDAKLVEDAILDIVPQYRPKLTFSGETECFKANQEQLDLLIDYMTSICNERNSAASSAASANPTGARP